MAHDHGVSPIAHPARSAPSQNEGAQLYSKTCTAGVFFCLNPRDICSFPHLIHGKLRHRKVKHLVRDCTAQSDAVSNTAAEKVHGAEGTSKSVLLRELLPPPSITTG